jgi:capsular polysaccharide export protein
MQSGQLLTALLAWGNKPSGRLAERMAGQRRLPLWRCEDGFLRSLGLGNEGPPLSLVLDDLGIYYDASRPSRLESPIASPLDEDGRRRAEALVELWRQERLSKYNGAAESPVPQQPFVLLVDHTADDLSIRGGLADGTSFAAMLQAARQAHRDCRIVLRLHPEVVRGRRRGHFAAADLEDPQLVISADGGHPAALLEHAEAIYVVTSQLGLEALLWGKPVHCFGMPFYAGWGLTSDVLPPPARRRAGSDRQRLIHAGLIDYPRYHDPHRGVRCESERLMAVIGLQQRRRRELPGRIEAFGFKPWKQPILRRFLAGSRLRFRLRNAPPIPGGRAPCDLGTGAR